MREIVPSLPITGVLGSGVGVLGFWGTGVLGFMFNGLGFRGSESWATAKVEGCGVFAQDCVSLPLQTAGPGAITEPTSIEDAWPGSARFRALFC